MQLKLYECAIQYSMDYIKNEAHIHICGLKPFKGKGGIPHVLTINLP